MYRREAQLRLADCMFMQRNYAGAAEAYEACAASFYDRTDIYPLYQSAVSYGLMEMDAKKIALLEEARGYSPDVKYYDYAMFELGRSYVKIDDDEKAEDVFMMLKENSSDSTMIAASTVELGSLYRNRLEYGKALEFYKEVVSEMPASVYSQDALAAIEAIYTASNDPQGYLRYIDSMGKSYLKSEGEKEEMVFNAAEQLFLKGDYQSALVSLADYLEKYPYKEEINDMIVDIMIVHNRLYDALRYSDFHTAFFIGLRVVRESNNTQFDILIDKINELIVNDKQ